MIHLYLNLNNAETPSNWEDNTLQEVLLRVGFEIME